MIGSDLCWTTATDLVRRIEAREVSVLAVVEAHLAQLERVPDGDGLVVERLRAAGAITVGKTTGFAQRRPGLAT